MTKPERTLRNAVVVDMACKGRSEKADSEHGPQRQRQLVKVILCVCRKNVDVLVKAGRCVLHDRFVVMQPILDPGLDLRGPPRFRLRRRATRRGRRGR